ncbi:MAG: DMT family transporter [Albidovulum sp.]
MGDDISYGRGVALVVSAAVMWSLMALIIRYLDGFTTWQVLFYRSLGMVPALLFVIWRRADGQTLAQIRAVGWPGVIGGTGLVMAFAGAIYAIQSTTVANAVFLFAASPLLTAVLAWLLLGERVRRATWGAIALAGIGVFVMVREGLSIGAGWGNVAALISASGFAAFTIALRWGRLSRMMPAVMIGGILSVLTAAAVITVRGEGFGVPASSAALAIFMGAGVLGLGLAIYTTGSRVVPAAELGILSMAEFILAPLWVWLLLGEGASNGTLIGGAILLASICLNALTGMRHRPPVLKL